MTYEEAIDPIRRLRTEAANRAKAERAELLEAYKDAVADDIRLTEAQRDELEKVIGEHAAWISRALPRLEALLPRTLAAVDTYENAKNLYRSQIFSVLQEAAQVSAASLWGSGERRDHKAFAGEVSRIKNRLGSARGLAGQLHREFLQIEIQLIQLERRGLGLPSTPVPTVKAPADTKSATVKVISDFDVRK